MAALGDIGKSQSLAPAGSGFSAFGRNQSASVTISVTGVTPLTNVFLITLNGMRVDRVAATTGGEAKFYDFDNGIYTIYSAGTSDVWQATVTTGSASVVKLFTGNRAMARAWIG